MRISRSGRCRPTIRSARALRRWQSQPDNPLALGRVEQLMHEVLSAIPRIQAVPWEQKNRLYELSYALTLGHEASVPYLAGARHLLETPRSARTIIHSSR